MIQDLPIDRNNATRAQAISRLLFVVLFLMFFIIVVIEFLPYEDTADSWGYWYFAKELTKGGSSVIVDRGPIYVAYLALFSWIDYPSSIDLSAFVSVLIFSSAFIVLFSRFVSNVISALCIVIWLPFIRGSEPMAQFLGFALIFLVAKLRSLKLDNKAMYVFYAYPALLLAYLCRPSFLVFILIYGICDCYLMVKEKSERGRTSRLISSYHLWLSIGLTAVILYYISRQSSSPWNNVWFADTVWFPNNGKSLFNGGGIQSLNWMYNQLTLGNAEGADMYHTNITAFGGNPTYLGAALNNPILFLKIIIHNTWELIPTLVSQTWIPYIPRYEMWGLRAALLTYILISAYQYCNKNNMLIIFVGGFLILISTILNVPKDRYVSPMIFITFTSAIQTVDNLRAMRKTIYIFDKGVLLYISKGLRNYLGESLAPILITLTVAAYAGMNFRTGYSEIVRAAFSQPIKSDDGFSLRRAHPTLTYLNTSCKGTMTLESTFFAAFIEKEGQHTYGVFEIPPFGRLHGNSYAGLNSSRVDCIFISHELRAGVGAGTTYDTRYRDYIAPYARELLNNGGIEVKIPNYGAMIRASGNPPNFQGL